MQNLVRTFWPLLFLDKTKPEKKPHIQTKHLCFFLCTKNITKLILWSNTVAVKSGSKMCFCFQSENMVPFYLFFTVAFHAKSPCDHDISSPMRERPEIQAITQRICVSWQLWSVCEHTFCSRQGPSCWDVCSLHRGPEPHWDPSKNP